MDKKNKNKKPFFERTRDDDPSIFLTRNGKVIYPPHYHGVFEIFVVKKGNFKFSINGKILTVSDNSVAVIDHYDMHYYLNDRKPDDFQYVMTIPHNFLTTFNNLRQNKRIINNVITDEVLCDNLIDIMNKYVRNTSVPYSYESQAAIDLIFSQLINSLEFTDEKKENDFELIKNILIYIENNFKEDVSRSTIAQAMGYTETHVSRTFHKYIGYTIPHYVNLLRLEYIQKHKDKNKSLAFLIMESGFKSIQSYYRNKKLLYEEIK